MRFNDTVLDELREIYRAEFHEEITRDQATEIGSRLVDLLKILLRQAPTTPGSDARSVIDSPRQ